MSKATSGSQAENVEKETQGVLQENIQGEQNINHGDVLASQQAEASKALDRDTEISKAAGKLTTLSVGLFKGNKQQ